MSKRELPIFTAVDISTTPQFVQLMSANYSFAVQAFWTGLSGSSSLTMEVSNDSIHWDEYPVVDKDGTRVTTVPISGATDSFTIVEKGFEPSFIRFTVEAGATGTLDVSILVLDVQDTY